MSGDEEIAFDKNRPATLHNGAISTDFPTLLDAVMAWQRLRPEQAQKASIKSLEGGFTRRRKSRSYSMLEGNEEELTILLKERRGLYAAAQIPKLLNHSKGTGD